MTSVSNRQDPLAAMVGEIFPDPRLGGVTVWSLDLPERDTATVAFLPWLVNPDEAEQLVCGPAAGPRRPVRDKAELEAGLFAGLVAIRRRGEGAAVLAGRGAAPEARTAFGPDLPANMALLRRNLPAPTLLIQTIHAAGQNPVAVAYLSGVADPDLVAEVTQWARRLSDQTRGLPWWRRLRDVFRVACTLSSPSPLDVAAALRQGYVAVFRDRFSNVSIAPVTIRLLFTGPGDTTRPPALQRVAILPRLFCAAVVLSLSAGLVAVTSYHHALMPGPFLVALAATRQNLPFPIVLEVLLLALLSDAMFEGAMALGSWRWRAAAPVGTLLSAMIALQAGFLTPITVSAQVLIEIAWMVVPNPTLGRFVRLWRYLFLGAAIGFGLYGIALIAFVLMVYLGEERPFGHPIRRQLG